MLTKVNMWDDEHGWQHVTVQEASSIYHHSINLHSNVFLCELCGQYINYIASQGRRLNYFRHNNKSEDCEEKSTGRSSYCRTNPLGFSLPLRIWIDGRRIEIFLGFLPLTEEWIKRASSKGAQLRIRANGVLLKTFNISSDRFLPNKISYLSVGSNFAERYEIDHDMDECLDVWPSTVLGFGRNGTMFSKESGRRLERNSNVVVGCEYVLLVPGNLPLVRNKDVSIEDLKPANGYQVFLVKAKSISLGAAEFFLGYGLRLTDQQAELTQVYPFAVKSHYVLLHQSEKVWFHKTKGHIDVSPNPSSRAFGSCMDMFAVSGGIKQILSLSRFEEHTGVLRYIMLRKVSSISQPIKAPKITVVDSKNSVVPPGESKVLPQKRFISVTPEYDGMIKVFKGDLEIDRVPLKGGCAACVDVDRNRSYRIYQGLDCVYKITFKRPKAAKVISDDDILKLLSGLKGKEVSVSHSLGSLSGKLADMPKTRIWLLKRIRTGKIYDSAIKILSQL